MISTFNIRLKKTVKGMVHVILVGLLSVGLYEAVSVSYLTVTGIAPCPTVVNVPACFIVTAGYFIMLITALFRHQLISKWNTKWLFIVGWAPVVLLALVGSALEFIQGDVCPKSDTGIPLCYISLSFAVSVAILYWLKTTRWLQ